MDRFSVTCNSCENLSPSIEKDSIEEMKVLRSLQKTTKLTYNLDTRTSVTLSGGDNWGRVQ